MLDVISKRVDKLPTLPGIAIKLLQEIQKPEVSLQGIGKLISSDPTLTSKLLKLVNSSFYSPRNPITTVDHAIKLLGLNAVQNLALSFCIMSGFREVPSKEFSLKQFWKDSLIGAIATKILADKVRRDSSADAFFLGLLQNIGSLSLACCMPDQYSIVLAASGKDSGNYLQAEAQVFGLSHTEVGEYLVKSWGLPERFYVPIAHHHSPESVDPKFVDSQIRAKLLNISSHCIDLFNKKNNATVSLRTIDQLLIKYEISHKEEAAELVKAIQAQAKEIFAIFDIEFNEKNYAEILDSANCEMTKLTLNLVNELFEKTKEIEFLRSQTVLDGLTSLTNYKGFHETLEREISRARRYKGLLSLVFADIDFFKKINDTYGHLAGDHALRAIALCLQSELRESDLLARYGGEEFGLILPETNLESAFFVAERLRENVQKKKITYKDSSFTATMSFGVASLPDKKISSEEFIKLADDALYNAKRLGRNRCCMAEKDKTI
jgi:diguanylate cyclase (GGDEF)-like protein